MTRIDATLQDFEAWELEAYADGIDIPRVAAFFEQHPMAYQVWQREQQFENQLKNSLYRFDCPAPETLHAYHWHELSTVEQRQFEAHLKLCPPCTAELQKLQAFVGVVSPVSPSQTPEAPAGQERWSPLQTLLEQMRIVIATLVTTPPQLAGATFRSESTFPPIQSGLQTSLLFDAEDVTISLLIERLSTNTFRLAAQFLSETPPDAAIVRLIAVDPAVMRQETQIDEVGNFVFSQLPAGNYQLALILPDVKTIVIPDLKLV